MLETTSTIVTESEFWCLRLYVPVFLDRAFPQMLRLNPLHYAVLGMGQVNEENKKCSSYSSKLAVILQKQIGLVSVTFYCLHGLCGQRILSMFRIMKLQDRWSTSETLQPCL